VCVLQLFVTLVGLSVLWDTVLHVDFIAVLLTVCVLQISDDDDDDNKMPRYRREDRAMGALKKIASPWLRPQLISPTF